METMSTMKRTITLIRREILSKKLKLKAWPKWLKQQKVKYEILP